MLVEQFLFFKSFLHFDFVIKFMSKEKQLFNQLDSRLGREVRQGFFPRKQFVLLK